MAIDPKDSNPNMDMEAHLRSYNLFIRIAQIGTAVVALILIGMWLFLV